MLLFGLSYASQNYEAELETLLKDNPNQAEKIRDIWNQCPEKWQKQMMFLLKSIPDIDLAEVSAEFMLGTIEKSERTKESFIWASHIPEHIYLQNVLPFRVTQEPLEDWKDFFYEKLYPIVKDTKTIEEAAIKVNYWCGEKIKFKQTERRDQGPFETYKSGYGRCEEMVIFFVAALRSVGIPTREAATPYWPHKDNNHAWTEIWTEEGWKYTGAAEPKDSLNIAWFSKTAKKTALVYSYGMGNVETDEEVYRQKEKYTIINSTANYRTTGTLQIDFSTFLNDKEKQAFVSVFNFSALRPIARVIADSTTNIGIITMGEGDYFVSADMNGKAVWDIVTIKKDETTELRFDHLKKTEEFKLWY